MRRGERLAALTGIALTLLVGAVLVFEVIDKSERTPPDAAPMEEPVVENPATAPTAPAPEITVVRMPPPPAPAPLSPPAPPVEQAAAEPPPAITPLQPAQPTPQPAVSEEAVREIVPLEPAPPPPQPEIQTVAIEPLQPNEVQVVPETPTPTRPVLQPAAPEQVASRSAPQAPRPQPVAAEPTAAPPSSAEVAQGRALLRILERGYGPSIEIAWPQRQRDRDQLFALFSRCFGLRVALMTAQGALYGSGGAPGEPLVLDIDYYSGFVRSPAGRLTAEERRQIAAVHASHLQVASASAIRIFPRRVDALLLGGLRAVIGEGYQNTSSIHATYRISGSSVTVAGIVADDRSFPGEIDLSPARSCA